MGALGRADLGRGTRVPGVDVPRRPRRRGARRAGPVRRRRPLGVGTMAARSDRPVFGHVSDALALFAAYVLATRARRRKRLAPGRAARGHRGPLRVPGRPRGAGDPRPLRLARGGRSGGVRDRVAGAVPPARVLGAYDWLAFGAPWRLSYSYTDNMFTPQQTAEPVRRRPPVRARDLDAARRRPRADPRLAGTARRRRRARPLRARAAARGLDGRGDRDRSSPSTRRATSCPTAGSRPALASQPRRCRSFSSGCRSPLPAGAGRRSRSPPSRSGSGCSTSSPGRLRTGSSSSNGRRRSGH